MSPRTRRRGVPLAVAACLCLVLLATPLARDPALLGRAIAASAVSLAGLAWMLSRLGDARLAAYGIAILATTPIVFLEARSMPRDLAAVAGSTLAFAGAALLSFDDRGAARRVMAGGMLLAGLALAGLTRGAVLGVAPPLVGAALAALLAEKEDRATRAIGAAMLLAGGVAVLVGVRGSFAVASVKPTFDTALDRALHASFPWSGLVPLAFASLLRRAPAADEAGDRDQALRATATGSLVAALVIAGFAPAGSAIPFVAPAALATSIAIALRDLDEPYVASTRSLERARLLAIVSALLLGLLAHDLELDPARISTSIAPLPSGAAVGPMSPWLFRGAAALALVIVLATFDGARDRDDLRARLSGWIDTLSAHWDGHLATALVAVEATLVSLTLWTALGLRAPAFTGWSEPARVAVRHAFWMFPAAVLGVVWIPVCLATALARVRRALAISRGELCALVGAAVAALLAFTCFPLLRS